MKNQVQVNQLVEEFKRENPLTPDQISESYKERIDPSMGFVELRDVVSKKEQEISIYHLRQRVLADKINELRGM